MSDGNAAGVQLIEQILLKPAAGVELNAQDELTAEYIGYLQNAVSSADSGYEDNAALNLTYGRRMSAGVHLLLLEPALDKEAAVSLTDRLTELEEVEYAEPDFPLGRRK
ncbi:MAG: hypothetical protein R3F02_17725 [Thiolinea sp.]